MSKSSRSINSLLTADRLSDADRKEFITFLLDSGLVEVMQDIGAANHEGARFPVLTTEQILDRLINETEAVSDYGVAKMLDIPRATVSRWRNEKTMSDENAHRVAGLLDEDPDYLVACLNAERSKSRAAKYSFERLARLAKGLSIVKKTKAAALVGVLAISGLAQAFYPASSAHAAAPLPSTDSDSRAVYIMLNYGIRLATSCSRWNVWSVAAIGKARLDTSPNQSPITLALRHRVVESVVFATT